MSDDFSQEALIATLTSLFGALGQPLCQFPRFGRAADDEDTGHKDT